MNVVELFRRKPKACPRCGLPYKRYERVMQWHTGGWVSGDGEKVPLMGHASYTNGQMLHYEFEWHEATFEEHLDLMPDHMLVCGCNSQ